MTTEEIEKVDKYVGGLKSSIDNIQHVARLLNLPEELDEDVDKNPHVLAVTHLQQPYQHPLHVSTFLLYQHWQIMIIRSLLINF